jgi:hypothetical protein
LIPLLQQKRKKKVDTSPESSELDIEAEPPVPKKSAKPAKAGGHKAFAEKMKKQK